MNAEMPCAEMAESTATTAPMVPGDYAVGREFDALFGRPLLSWTVNYRLIRRLGSGGQGVVYLAEKIGTDGLRVPVALKFFSRQPYADGACYADDMKRMACIAAKVALIQQDHLLDVHDFVEIESSRIMVMEWVDGLDLHYLLSPGALASLESHVGFERWSYLNDVVITKGQTRARLKPGIAVAIIRECLAALAALHRSGIVHSDIKPSNIMLKRTGNAKIVDFGSACESARDPSRRPLTPRYSSAEVLESGQCTPYSDLVSLGYVLVELLSGRAVFTDLRDRAELVAAKRLFARDLPHILPSEVLASESLMHLVRTLVAPDLLSRVPGAEAADLMKFVATTFHHELVNGNLASEYETEIRLWLRDVGLQSETLVRREDYEV